MNKLKKCLIANRGEIAVRVIRACREIGIATVAVYSDVDAHALHVQMADEAYLIGTAAASDSYLRGDVLIETARRSGCDSVHPGYGFLSESADFAQAVMDAGLIWVGPPPDAIRRMGVKTEARDIMAAADVPVVPGFQSEGASDDAIAAAANKIGYPVMVKAAGGGGGKGIRIVRDAAELQEAVTGARREAQKAFGDARIFLEKFIERGRHIEIQVLADKHGNTLHLFERECSTQRRHQKIIEETPSPLLDDAMRAKMGAAAVAAAQAVGYVNAGTVEFIATESGEFYFLEMNTRLQVEHPVTEMVTGVDLVRLQMMIAAGDVLPFAQSDLQQIGHAIECRLYAEDARNGFLPATGTVQRFIPPDGPGVRVDSGIRSGDTITIHYDPMVAKVIVQAANRSAAIERMQQALSETVVLGTTTNVDFLQTLLQSDAFRRGNIHTRYVDEHLTELLPDLPALDDAALILAALSETATQTNTTMNNQTESTGADRYSPWAVNDGFRIGG